MNICDRCHKQAELFGLNLSEHNADDPIPQAGAMLSSADLCEDCHGEIVTFVEDQITKWLADYDAMKTYYDEGADDAVE